MACQSGCPEKSSASSHRSPACSASRSVSDICGSARLASAWMCLVIGWIEVDQSETACPRPMFRRARSVLACDEARQPLPYRHLTLADKGRNRREGSLRETFD